MWVAGMRPDYVPSVVDLYLREKCVAGYFGPNG